ncbi:hypothetical protein FOHLNKBM_3703 [Methylobacterium longum]|jgi:hypothetical protein|nr:hypothetical protein FOHLNKBM_3703 [Methylobacterium longum]
MWVASRLVVALLACAAATTVRVMHQLDEATSMTIFPRGWRSGLSSIS